MNIRNGTGNRTRRLQRAAAKESRIARCANDSQSNKLARAKDQ